MATLPKSQLQSNISSELGDNVTGQISPYDIRHNLIDITDSINNLISSTQNLTVGALSSTNFSTPATRNVSAGVESLDNIDLNGYMSIDNSAFGYATLRSNYQSSGNAAFGSQSLSCNIYGSNNAGLGYKSLGANIDGFGNVGVGSFTLNKNKNGNFNIAIGNGAGYYVDKNTNNKLYIGAHPVDETHVCANPLGSGFTPLLHGDLSSNELCLGIGTRTLNARTFGVLQTSGNISPTLGSTFDIGHSSYPWMNIHLSDNILFSSAAITSDGTDVIMSGNIMPYAHKSYQLGKAYQLWNKAFIEDLHVSGVARINSLISTQQNHFLTKTINLASSGAFNTIDGGGVQGLTDSIIFDPETNNPSGYLADIDLDGAGLIIRASGGPSTTREFEMIFKPSGKMDDVLINSRLQLPYTVETDTIHSRSSWFSNVSLHLDSGCHIKTPRVTDSGRISITTYDDRFGLYIDSGHAFFTHDTVLNPHPASSGGYGHGSGLAGIGEVNFLGASGSDCNYFTTIAHPESGTTVGQRLLTGVKDKRSGDDGRDRLQGFEIKYVDNSSLEYEGAKTDRLLFSSYDNDSTPLNHIMLLKNNSDGGVFGVNNFETAGESILPTTIVNIRSKNDAEVRITAENTGSVDSAIQLLASSNCEVSGLEIKYGKNESFATGPHADFNLFHNSGVINFMHVDPSGRVGISCSGKINETLTIGDSGTPSGVISLFESPSIPTSTIDYGKIYVERKITDNQSQALKFIDSSGNTFDFLKSKYISFDGLVYMDSSFNTFAGSGCNDDRNDVDNGALRNTGYGHFVFNNITNTFSDNTVVGFSGGNSATSYLGSNVSPATASGNTLIGSHNATGLYTGKENVFLGRANQFAASDSTLTGDAHWNAIKNIGRAIAVGNNLRLRDYEFKLGASESLGVLMSGLMGPAATGHQLTIANGARLLVESQARNEYFNVAPRSLEHLANDKDRPSANFKFHFSGSGVNNDKMTLLTLNHSADMMSGVNFIPTFATATPARPFVSISGDLNLVGAIRFRDGSSIEDTKYIDNIKTSGTFTQSSGVSLSGQFYNAMGNFEGFMVEGVDSPNNFFTPTSGRLRINNYDQNSTSEKLVYITNRDQYLGIKEGDYIVVTKIDVGSIEPEFRPIWISNKDLACNTCCK
jgi:hypothetical protein